MIDVDHTLGVMEGQTKGCKGWSSVSIDKINIVRIRSWDSTYRFAGSLAP